MPIPATVEQFLSTRDINYNLTPSPSADNPIGQVVIDISSRQKIALRLRGLALKAPVKCLSNNGFFIVCT